MNKLIKLSDTHYIIVDDSEIKDTSYFIDNNKIFECRNVFDEGIEDSNGLIHNHKNCKKITHSTEPLIITRYFTDKILEKYNGLKERIISIQFLSLVEVEEAIYEYNLDDLTFNEFEKQDEWNWSQFKDIFTLGFKAHQKLVKDKLLITDKSLFDFLYFEKTHSQYSDEAIVKEFIDELLKKQTEWNIKFDQNGKIILI